MCKLQCEINRVQQNILLDKASLAYHNHLLKASLKHSYVLPIAMVGGFGIGYWLGRIPVAPGSETAMGLLPHY